MFRLFAEVRRGMTSNFQSKSEDVQGSETPVVENGDRREVALASDAAISKLDAALTADIASVARIDAVASILKVACRTTGMGFAAVARVTEGALGCVCCARRNRLRTLAGRRTGRQDHDLRRDPRQRPGRRDH